MTADKVAGRDALEYDAYYDAYVQHAKKAPNPAPSQTSCAEGSTH